MIPSIAVARMINESQHLERSFLYAREEHRREIEQGAIRTWIGILCVRVIEVQRDTIYLFCDHSV